MTFWNWRRGTGAAATSGSSAIALATDLAPVELYTADARIVGWIAANGQRVTDLLNGQDELHLWHPSPGPIDGAVAAGEPSAVGDPDAGNGEWQALATDRIILAMPPEWRASRQLRLHRRLRRVALSAGPFSVTGNLHLPPGRRWAPICSCAASAGCRSPMPTCSIPASLPSSMSSAWSSSTPHT